MPAEIEFTEGYLVRMIALEKGQEQILSEIKEIKDTLSKINTDHEARIRYVEVHGSNRAQEVDKVLCQLAKDHSSLKDEFHYNQGKLYFIFLGFGAAVSAFVSWLVTTFSGGN